MTTVKELGRGSVVQAAKDMDPAGAHVERGDVGVVFQEHGFHGPDEGPMVRWIVGHASLQIRDESETQYASHQEKAGGVCNIYEGDVWVLEAHHKSDK